MLPLDAGGDRDHFLDELGADQRREEAGARAGEEDAVLAGREAGLGLHPIEELDDLLGLAGVVPLIVLPGDLAVLHHHRLDGGGADVDAEILHLGRRHGPAHLLGDVQDGLGRGAGGGAVVRDLVGGLLHLRVRVQIGRTSSTVSPVRASTSSNSRWARFLASVRIIWQRESAWTSASPLISSGA